MKPGPDLPSAARGDKGSVRASVSGWMEEIAPYGIFTTDNQLVIRSWNRWLITHSGRPADSVIGRPLTEVYPDLEARRLLSRFQRALAGEISVLSTALHKYLLPFEATVQDSALPHMLQTARVAPLPGPDGIGGTITIIEDVTQREFQAATLRRQQELDRLLSTALAAMLQPADPAQQIAQIFAPLMPPFGLDAYFCYLWQPAEREFRLRSAGGISPRQREAAARLGLADGDRISPQGSPLSVDGTTVAHLRMLEGLGIKGRRCWPLAIGGQVTGFVSFGSYQWNEISATDGSLLFRIVHFLAIAIDRAAKEREAVAASRAKDDFLAALSHELRTPLNPVLLVASDSAENLDFPLEARMAFRAIEKNAQLEARLIDDLLDLTRIEHGKLRLDLAAIDAHVPVRDALANVGNDAAEKGIAIEVELAAGNSVVQADGARLQQVFWNVLKNAIKFTPSGGCVRLASTTTPDDREWVLEISDTGIGMEPHELSRVFNAFTQGDHASVQRGHRFGGLGLGLAICQRLMDLHAGRIAARSEGRERGSVFVIRLPLASAQRTDPAPASSTESTSPLGSSFPLGPRPRLLLVEDHEPTRAPLANLLIRRGFAVTGVGSAEEALQAAKTRKFDLVLSDIGLPDQDGFSLMRRLHEDYGLRGIALTGYGMETDVASSAAAGFVAHLTKPINAMMLDRTLKSAFEANDSAADTGK